VGLLLAIALKVRGLARIALADLEPDRLDLVESFGFAPVPLASADLAGRRHAMDLVVDATGKTTVAAALPDYAAAGGSCLFFGICPPGETVPVSPFDLFRRQITLVGTHSLNHNIAEALDALRAGGPDAARLVSHRVGLDEIAAILTEGAPQGSLKVQAVTG
jgi:D-altritol 5-dehydrogenase